MRHLLTSLIALTLTLSSSAQSPYQQGLNETGAAVQIERQTTGSGHLNFTALGASYRYGKSEFFAGAIFQDGSRSFKGMKMTYRFFPQVFGATVRPYFQYDLVGRWDSRLNSELESILHPEDWQGDRHERYRTIEHHVGFGVKPYMWGGLYLDLGVGLGVYQSRISSTFDDRIEDARRFRKKMDASLTLKAGVGYEF